VRALPTLSEGKKSKGGKKYSFCDGRRGGGTYTKRKENDPPPSSDSFHFPDRKGKRLMGRKEKGGEGELSPNLCEKQ